MDFYRGNIPILDNVPTDRDILYPRDAAFGLVLRDYNLYPQEMFESPSEMDIIPESDWDAWYDEQEATKSSLEHLYLGEGLASPRFVNLDQNGHGYCLREGTMVKLADGSEKPIEKFVGGEMVVTHLDRSRKVLRPTSREYSGKMVTTWVGNASRARKVTATIDHEFLDGHHEWKRLDEIGPTGSVIHNGRVRFLSEFQVSLDVTDQAVYCLEVEEDHSFIANDFTVHNCWSYSTGHALMFNYLSQNSPIIRLNPHATAAIIMGGKDQGGWCGLSAKWATENGYAVEGTGLGQWPLHSRNLRYDTDALRASMKLHRSSEQWTDLSQYVYNRNLTRSQFATALLSGFPCPSDWSQWAHSVAAIRWVRIERGSWAPLIINSWKGWGRFGLGVLRMNGGTPNGALCIRSVTPSVS